MAGNELTMCHLMHIVGLIWFVSNKSLSSFWLERREGQQDDEFSTSKLYRNNWMDFYGIAEDANLIGYNSERMK